MGCRKPRMEKLSPESEVHPASQRRGSVELGSPVSARAGGRPRVPLGPLPTLWRVGLEEQVREWAPQPALSASQWALHPLPPLPYALRSLRRGWNGCYGVGARLDGSISGRQTRPSSPHLVALTVSFVGFLNWLASFTDQGLASHNLHS